MSFGERMGEADMVAEPSEPQVAVAVPVHFEVHFEIMDCVLFVAEYLGIPLISSFAY